LAFSLNALSEPGAALVYGAIFPPADEDERQTFGIKMARAACRGTGQDLRAKIGVGDENVAGDFDALGGIFVGHVLLQFGKGSTPLCTSQETGNKVRGATNCND
jgi:hypothetical protein